MRLIYRIRKLTKERSSMNKEILFFKYSCGLATPEEEKLLQKLLANSENARNELKTVEEIIAIDNEIKELDRYDTSKGYIGMRQKVKAKKKTAPFIVWMYRVAAILILPLLISIAALIHTNQMQQNELNRNVWMEVVSAPGLISRFELPDQSKVWLNSGSRLRYPSHFNGAEREVKLAGEGYFEVSSDKEHPFYVTTETGVKVMAHGTSFNVNTYNEYDVVEAVLVKGKIDLSFAGQTLRKMIAGEEAIFNKTSHQLMVNKVNTEEKTAWKDGKIMFRNATLEQVFKQLERRYNVDIIVHDVYKSAANYRCRVTFTNETIQQIFTYLEVAAPIRWAIDTPKQQGDSSLVKQRIDVWLNKK